MANVKLLYLNPTTGYHQEANPSSDNVQVGKVSTVLGADMGGSSITSLGTPVNSTDAATKAYVDAVGQGLSPKASVVALSSSNISSLSGTTTIDGIAITSGQRVLLTGQSTASQDGIWLVQSGSWVRPSDFATGGSAAGSYAYVEEGTSYGKQLWSNTNIPGSDVIDTNSLTFTQIGGAGQYTAGNGISIASNLISANLLAGGGLTFSGTALAVAVNASGGLQNTSTGISALLNGTTLASAAAGLSVLGLPSTFTVAGVSTAPSVTAAALNTLSAGATSAADSLHTHASAAGAANLQATYANAATALAIGDPVFWSTTADTVSRATTSIDASALVIGVAGASIAASASGVVVSAGVVKNALSSATIGGQVWLGTSGGLTQTKPLVSGARIIRVGIAKNATDLWVQIVDQGKLA